VVDDIHYFVPDFLDSIIVKGSVTGFDRFVSDQMMIEKLHKDRKVSTKLVYVSEANSSTALQNFCYEVLSAAGRQDLNMLPRVSKAADLTVDKDFYGKTYAELAGNPKVYDVADTFGEMISEDNPEILNSPRLLKHLIKQSEKNRRKIDYDLFKDRETAKGIVRGRTPTTAQVVQLFYNKAGEVTTEFYRNIYDISQDLEGKTSETMKDMTYAQEEMNRNLESVKESWGRIRDVSVPIIVKTDLRCKVINIPVGEDLDAALQKHKRLSEDMEYSNPHQIGYVKDHLSNTISISRKIPDAIREEREALKRADLRCKSEKAQYTTKMCDIQSTLEHYKAVLKSKVGLEIYPAVYKEVKESALARVSLNPTFFSSSDTNQIMGIISDPKSIIRRVNPHTIDLIMNLDVIG
jgi:hypothetical protein